MTINIRPYFFGKIREKMIKVAVLMATHNGAKYIKDQIDSIMRQKNIELELFISDDKSTDKTLEIIESCSVKYKNINLINVKKVGGPAKNFYFLINYINIKNFDYIALSDQDDFWPNYRLSDAINKLINQNAEAYSSDVIAVDHELKFIKVIKKSFPLKRYDFIFETPGPGCTFVMSANFMCYLQSRLNNDLLNFPYHDWLIYALARRHHFKWIIDDQPSMLYRQHDNNFIGGNIGYKSALRRSNRILFGDYYKELVKLYSFMEFDDRELDFYRVWKFIFTFNHTRRILFHALVMIPFLIILSIQKNEA